MVHHVPHQDGFGLCCERGTVYASGFYAVTIYEWANAIASISLFMYSSQTRALLSLIARLLLWCSPADVSGLIVSIFIGITINRFPRRAGANRAHDVLIENQEVMPLVTYFDFTSAIIVIAILDLTYPMI